MDTTSRSPEHGAPDIVGVMDEPDTFIPTASGADVRRSCGCTERLDANWDAWILVDLCREHAEQTTKVDGGLLRLLDPEIDLHVTEAAGQHRVARIRPKDETRSKR